MGHLWKEWQIISGLACVRGSGDRESNFPVGWPGGLIRCDGTGKKCKAAAAETVTGLQQSSLA